MRHDHVEVFFDAAQHRDASGRVVYCWIGLREPNPFADRWIGRVNAIPKPVSCKAKTADNPNFPFAGLVVDPVLRPEAFEPGSLAGAVDCWNEKFALGGRLPVGFTRDDSGPEAGLVKLGGSAIFADFDLMAISRSNASGERLFTSEQEERELFTAVEPILARGLGVPMIQHGTEFSYEGVGARPSEQVFWFGPGRRFEAWPSSMPLPHRRGGGH